MKSYNQLTQTTRVIRMHGEPVIQTDHVELVKEYAQIVRGEHPRWEGDRVRNAESFAFSIGADNDDALELVRSLGIAEREYSLLTGLPSGSLRRMSAQIKRGHSGRN